MPENAPLYDGMRVRELLLFMARIKGLGGEAATAAIDAAVARLALARVLPLSIGKLSKGFRQRVAIAQALLGRPEILILDEPTNGLDPAQIIEMRGLIRALAGEMTILVTSHILAEMERVADRVAILVEGRLLAVRALRAIRFGAASPRRGPWRRRARACLPRARARRAGGRGGGVFARRRRRLRRDRRRAGRRGSRRGEPGRRRHRAVRTRARETDLEALFLQLTSGAPAIPQSPAVA